MEKSQSKRRRTRSVGVSELPAKSSTTVKLELLDVASHEQAYTSGTGNLQEASSSNYVVKSPLPDEVEIGETGIQCEDTVFTIEEVDFKAGNMSTDENEGFEDEGEMVGTSTKRRTTNDDTESGDSSSMAKKPRQTHTTDIHEQAAVKPVIKSRRQNISIEKKKQIVQLYLDQHRVTDIGNIMQLNTQTVSRIVHSYLKNCQVVDNSHKKGGPHLKKLNDEQLQTMNSWLEDECSLSLRQIAERCREAFGVQLSLSTIRNYLPGFSYTIKRIQLPPDRCQDPQTVEARKRYALRFKSLQAELDDTNFVFLNEVGFHVSFRSKNQPGKLAKQFVSASRQRYITICCFMSRNGLVAYASTDGAFDLPSFEAFMEQLKAGLTRSNITEPIIFIDSLVFQKTGSVRTFAEVNKIKLENLPPNSPLLNPIESMFSEWKGIVERANPHNETEVMSAIKGAAGLITKQDCDKYYRNMLEYVTKSCDEEAIKRLD